MTKINKENIKFKLYAQNRDNILIIENLEEKNYIRCTANEVIANESWIKQFSAEDSKIIYHIAETEMNYEYQNT